MSEFPAATEGSFAVRWNFGGLTSLKCRHDVHDTDYIWPGETLGNVIVNCRQLGEQWHEESAFSSGDIRQVEIALSAEPQGVRFAYAGKSRGVKGIRSITLAVEFSSQPDALFWEITLRNQTDQPLEIGDIALPLPFNKEFVADNLANYTKVVGRHAFISGHGSFIFWERPSGVGPYLLMTPLSGTKIEYYEQHDQDRRAIRSPYWIYLHSACNGAGEARGTWRQPHTSITLAPKGQRGDMVAYGFKFRWVPDYDGVRDALVEEGLFDVQIVPGMTVPIELEARIAVRTRVADFILEPEHPDQTRVEFLGKKDALTYLYRVIFQRLGENVLTMRYNQDQYMILEFFATEPLETLIKKRTDFLVSKQQHRDPEKWYDGLFSVWDMRSAVLRGPDDTDGFDYWWGYVLACDDTALPKAPFIAAKNLYYPVKEEIAAVEYYLDKFVWGKLQRTDQEDPLPYGIYGVPNWFENRYHEWGFQPEGMDQVYQDGGLHLKGKGQAHIWRNFDYPHVMMIYFHLYQIARKYPEMVSYLDAPGYLRRAYGTARAYFDIQNHQPGWGYWAYTLGIYNELLIVDLIMALRDEGLPEESDILKGEWEKKVKYFIYDDPYPFDSEYPFDTTAFESSHAIAKYALSNELEPDENLWYDENKKKWFSHPKIQRKDAEAFMEKQIQANIALRGWVEPAYYLLGSDFRGGEGVRYNLSYMSQMGGWAILDYAMNYAKDPFPYLRLGYASYLSSWALMNTGTPESNYGYWYPGPANDGATGWAVTPEKYGPMWIRKDNPRGAWPYDGEIELGYAGGLRMAATILAHDPLFGLIAYGGILEEIEGAWAVVPQDGLRSRFCIVESDRRLMINCDWDGFAAGEQIIVRKDGTRIDLRIENRSGVTHTMTISVNGMQDGSYAVTGANGLSTIVVKSGRAQIPVLLGADGTQAISLQLAQP